MEVLIALIVDAPFAPNVRVDEQPDASHHAEVSGDVFGSGAYDTWIDMTYDTRYDVSSDTGKTWGVDQLDPGSDCCDGVVRAYRDTVHLIWLALYNTAYMRSTNAGAGWQASTDISQCSSTDHPWVTTIGRRVGVVWADFCVNTVRVAYSSDGGGTWTRSNASSSGAVPFIASDDTSFYAMWWGSGSGYIPIGVSQSFDGVNWTQRGTAAQMTDAIQPNPYPVGYHAAGWGLGNMGLLVQTGTLANLDVEFVKTTDYGANWGAPVKVADNPTAYTEYNLALAVDPYDGLHAFWYDNRKGSGVWGLYYAYSSDGGSTWSSSDTRVSDTDFVLFDKPPCSIYNISYGQGCWPGHYIDAAADSNYVYVTWADNRVQSGGSPYYHIFWTYAPVPGSAGAAERPPVPPAFDPRLVFVSGELRFTLPVRMRAELSVWSADGRLVSRPLSGLSSRGEHRLSPGALPAGVYIAVLRADNAARTVKFVLEGD